MEQKKNNMACEKTIYVNFKVNNFPEILNVIQTLF